MSFFSSVIVNGEFLEFKVFDTLFHVLDSIHEQRKIVKKIIFRYISRVLYFAFSMHEPWRKKQTIQDLQKVSVIPEYVKKKEVWCMPWLKRFIMYVVQLKTYSKNKKKVFLWYIWVVQVTWTRVLLFFANASRKTRGQNRPWCDKKWMITIAKQNVAAVDSQTGVS